MTRKQRLAALIAALARPLPSRVAELAERVADHALTDELTGWDLDTMTADIPTHAMRERARHVPILGRAIHRMNPMVLT